MQGFIKPNRNGLTGHYNVEAGVDILIRGTKKLVIPEAKTAVERPGVTILTEVHQQRGWRERILVRTSIHLLLKWTSLFGSPHVVLILSKCID